MDDPRILGPIPTPPAQRWKEIRLLYLPRAVFALGVVVVAILWKSQVAPATIIAQAEIQQAEVRSEQAGVLTTLNARPLQAVHAGDILGYVGPAQAPGVKLDGEAAGSTALVAPIDGVIALVFKRVGDPVLAGDLIVKIGSRKTNRLTGYLRQPLTFEPTVGTAVELRTRGTPRRVATSHITSVGAAMEQIPASLAAVMKLSSSAAQEPGLRVHIALPAGLELRPGEYVDVNVP